MDGGDFNRLVSVLERIATALEAQGKPAKPAAKPRKRGRTLEDMCQGEVDPEDVARAVEYARASGFVVCDTKTRKPRA